MTFDQKIQIWNTVGTWLAGMATFAAVVVSLYLSRKRDRVNLKVHAGLRLHIVGDGSPAKRIIVISVTNRGERPVIVNTVGWRIGRGKNARFCIQTVGRGSPDDYPKELAHGKSATFSIDNPEAWASDILEKFLQPATAKHMRTLKAQVNTSVGETVESTSEESLQRFLVERALALKAS